MRKVIVHIIYLSGLIFTLLMTACVDEVLLSGHPDGEATSNDKVRIEIFTRANSYNLPSTKGLDDENTVGKTPWVLVFKGENANATFVEAVQAFELIGKRYVILTKQPDNSKYQLLILANPQNQFYYGNAATGYDFETDNLTLKMIPGVTTLSDACSNLQTVPLASPSQSVIPYSGVGESIPMSYLHLVDKIDNTTKIENSDGTSLQLTRTVAKMVIINNASDFELKGITAVVNVPRQGRLHNWDGSIMDNTSNLTEYRYDAIYSSPLINVESLSGVQSTEGSPIYLYESAKSNNTYIIIQGTYKNQDYYYKMAIAGTDLQLMNILRNRSYTFTIAAVKGPGFSTVADAKVSQASNTVLDFTVLVDDSNSYEITANNNYYLAVSNSVFIAYTSQGGNYEAFKLVTDCKIDFPNSRNITDNEKEIAEWSFSLQYPTDGKIPIVDDNVSPHVTPVGVYVSNWLQWYEEGQKDPNPPYAERENAYIILQLGNLEKRVHIRQRNAVPATGAVLKYMPTNNINTAVNEVNYYCLSGYVEDGDDDPKNWIKLLSSSEVEREDTDNITVENGKIYIKVMPNNTNSERVGVVYLTTIKNPYLSSGSNATQRIKIYITQSGKEVVNVNTI